MFEKVNPCHPDKIADRISGALVDIAYANSANPKVACEVLIGHNECNIIIESSYEYAQNEVEKVVYRIVGSEDVKVNLLSVQQDTHLATNQAKEIRCGDNGIFKGVPATSEEKELTEIAKDVYDIFGSDGKYILNDNKLIICQSNTKYDTSVKEILKNKFSNYDVVINPIGEWTGGINTDSGCTNRKLGSDMAQSVTGGGLFGKDLSKADVSVNIYAWLKAQATHEQVELFCAIGDSSIDGMPYAKVVDIAREYIESIGGFEKFAEWGLVRPIGKYGT